MHYRDTARGFTSNPLMQGTVLIEYFGESPHLAGDAFASPV
ncbi:hypothetical protein C4J92_2162 [Pseudomonas sp. R3-18-08]|nr:hypothetical protein C4J92_2162 [Pseudomonas sp. R3-18-08]